MRLCCNAEHEPERKLRKSSASPGLIHEVTNEIRRRGARRGHLRSAHFSFAAWPRSAKLWTDDGYSRRAHEAARVHYAYRTFYGVAASGTGGAAGNDPVVIAFTAATSTIPIVAFMLDPLKAGLVTSLSRPGGNLTGITLDPGIEIWGKRLEMLKEAIPSTVKAAFLGMREGWEGSSGQALRDAAGRLGISLVSMF